MRTVSVLVSVLVSVSAVHDFLYKAVEVHSVDAMPEINGRTGSVIGFHSKSSRWMVALGSGKSHYKIKAENLADVDALSLLAANTRTETRAGRAGVGNVVDASTIDGVTVTELAEIIESSAAMADEHFAAACCRAVLKSRGPTEARPLLTGGVVRMLADAILSFPQTATSIACCFSLQEMSTGFPSSQEHFTDMTGQSTTSVAAIMELLNNLQDPDNTDGKLTEEQQKLMIQMQDPEFMNQLQSAPKDVSNNWAESEEGQGFKSALAEHGGCEAAVSILNSGYGLGTMGACQLISTTCLGTAGQGDSAACPSCGGTLAAATARRENCKGGIEAILNLVRYSGDDHPLHDIEPITHLTTTIAFTALARLVMGQDKQGIDRRARAAALGAIPLLVRSLARHFSTESLTAALDASVRIANGNKELKEQWDAELREHPALIRKLHKVMLEKMEKMGKMEHLDL
jgi:hypothetical protein